jgi:ribosomal protein L40E
MHALAHPAFTLPALAILVTLGYLARIALKPFKTCRRCHGTGRIVKRGILRQHLTLCRLCHGKGLRPRAIHAALRGARKVKRDAFDPTERSRS